MRNNEATEQRDKKHMSAIMWFLFSSVVILRMSLSPWRWSKCTSNISLALFVEHPLSCHALLVVASDGDDNALLQHLAAHNQSESVWDTGSGASVGAERTQRRLFSMFSKPILFWFAWDACLLLTYLIYINRLKRKTFIAHNSYKRFFFRINLFISKIIHFSSLVIYNFINICFLHFTFSCCCYSCKRNLPSIYIYIIQFRSIQ